MLTLYHAPQSRSCRIIALLKELDALGKVDVEIVRIARYDGSGGADPKNPHPEGKVPLLVHDGVEIWESSAIILYLTDLFPAAKLGPVMGDPLRGAYLSWLAWYAGVVEPVLVLAAAGLTHPYIDATFRGVHELTNRLAKALEHSPYLMGDRYTAADLLLHSPYAWYAEMTPDVPAVKDWIARCMDRPSARFVTEFDAARSIA